MNLVSHPINSMFGEVNCPGDKSISQRILILGSLLNCDMEIEGFLDAEDPNSTLEALNKLGASIRSDANRIYLKKRNIAFCNPSEELNLGNSGTGARLLLGLISGLGIKSRIVGDHSLSNRPMSRVISPLSKMGAVIQSKEGTLPITTNFCNISNHFEYFMPLASAQVKSCLLLAALSSKNNIKITEPKVTRDHTERMIEFFGGEISFGNEDSFGQVELKYQDLSTKDYYIIPGDFSSASFIIVASILANNSEILIKNVGLNKTRSGLIEILLLMGANIIIKNKKILSNEEVGDIIIKSSNLNGVEVPENIIPNIIDEIPILSIAAAFASGRTVIKNAAELRVKESDRLNAISKGLSKLRINHEIFDDGISIIGTKDTIECDENIDSFDDHRIAMSFLIAGIRSKGSITVQNCKNIETSFPKFKDTMNSLGMNINEKN